MSVPSHVASLVKKSTAEILIRREYDLKKTTGVLREPGRVRLVKVRNLVNDLAKNAKKL